MLKRLKHGQMCWIGELSSQHKFILWKKNASKWLEIVLDATFLDTVLVSLIQLQDLFEICNNLSESLCFKCLGAEPGTDCEFYRKFVI